MEFFKNIVLKAKNSAAVLIVFIVAVVVVGIYGEGPLANDAMSLLYILAGMIILDLVRNLRK